MILVNILYFAVPAVVMALFAYFTHARPLCFLPSLVTMGAYLIFLAIDHPMLAPMRRRFPDSTLNTIFIALSVALLIVSLVGVYWTRNLNWRFFASLIIQGPFIFYVWFWLVWSFFSNKP